MRESGKADPAVVAPVDGTSGCPRASSSGALPSPVSTPGVERLIEELEDLIDFHIGASDGLPTIKSEGDEVAAMRASVTTIRQLAEALASAHARNEELAEELRQFRNLNDAAQEAFNRTLIRAEAAESQLTDLTSRHEALTKERDELRRRALD